jgi:hypothetical protein
MKNKEITIHNSGSTMALRLPNPEIPVSGSSLTGPHLTGLSQPALR